MEIFRAKKIAEFEANSNRDCRVCGATLQLIRICISQMSKRSFERSNVVAASAFGTSKGRLSRQPPSFQGLHGDPPLRVKRRPCARARSVAGWLRE